MNIFRSRFHLAYSYAVILSMAIANLSVFAVNGGSSVIDPDKFSVWTVVGPDGGDVRDIVIDPRDKDRLYISTLDGQVYTSGDGGRNWRLLVNLNEPQLNLDQLMVDSRDSKVIYASGHRHKSPGGFFKSTDGGVTWKESKDLKNASIHAMTQSEKDPNQLFVGTLDGVWMSKNSGDDWERMKSDSMPVNVNSLAIDPRNTSTIYAGTWWRPYKSTDSGKNWKLIKTGMIDDSDVFAITINSENRDHLFASACSGIYESLNGGEKWTKVQGIPSQSRRTRDIVQHPSKQGTVYAATTEGFWMSVNGGKSWAMTTSRSLEVNAIAVHPEAPDRVFIATNNYGVMVSNDGGKNFTPTNASFTSRFTYSVTPDVDQPNRLYATTHNTATSGGFLFVSSDAGRSWTPARGLDILRVSPWAVLQDRVNPNQMYLGSNQGIFKSIDRGNSWTLIAPPKKIAKKPAAKRKITAAQRKATAEAAAKADAEPKLVPVLAEKVKVLAFTEDEKNGILAGTDKGLYRTYDVSKGWEKLSFGDGINDNIFAVYSSALVPGTIWVGTATSGVIVSRDDGKTWSKVGGAPENVPVSSIVGDPKRPNYIYVGTIQSLYLSRDGGRTWNRRGGNLPLGNYKSILINPRNSDEVFVSSALESDGGIFYSDNAGEKWKRIDSKGMNIPSRRIWAMAFDPSDSNRIYAGTHSGGVYRIDRIHDAATAAAGEPANKD